MPHLCHAKTARGAPPLPEDVFSYVERSRNSLALLVSQLPYPPDQPVQSNRHKDTKTSNYRQSTHFIAILAAFQT